ncbi:c-type heme family protein [sulfur-oxidizing endosymbiont of Gigantopelta aegis]|uniref:c-type heme family protein n=1 Tax=sulfur-oxidizing endosymbiont of Gigantopelta aegis TaxID=2794934 RepID=UPI0018DD5AC2|nr:DUF3365 domain-containing protein [sulfur-oxidizing endosymbiont of Gigantopelta aegis]
MKTIALTVVLSSLFLLPTIVFSSDNQTQLLQESRQSVKQFASSLKGELKAAMKKGGPVNAIQVCNERAIPITDTASQKNGVTLSRTSLKIRNPANVAEAWEHKILQNFEDRKNNGESPKKWNSVKSLKSMAKNNFAI